MAVRNIKKNLAGMEDLLQGVGTEVQVRGDANYTLGRVDVPYAVDTVAKMQALDVTLFTRARVYSDTTNFVDYIYDPDSIDGITPNVGAGSWVFANTSSVTVELTTSILSDNTSVDRFISTYYDNSKINGSGALWIKDGTTGTPSTSTATHIYNANGDGYVSDSYMVFKSVADAKNTQLFVGQKCRVENPSCEYLVQTTAAVDGFFDHAVVGGNIITAQTESILNVEQAGAIGDDLTSNNAVFTAIEARSETEFYVPEGTYIVTGLTLNKTYRGPGKIKLDGVIQDNDTDFQYVNPQGSRNSLVYSTGTSVDIKGKSYPMGGFRMHGSYYKTKAPVFETTSFLTNVDIPTSLTFGMSDTIPGWYAVFATADQGDTTPTFIVVPYIRVGSVSVDVVTLNSTEEGSSIPTAVTQTWGTNALAGTECLVINETISGRTNSFSGRVTTITANDTTTVTLAAIGSIAAGDWLLPAPNNKEFYRYCGTFLYEDAGSGNEEVRNIADTSSEVKAKMITNANFPGGSLPLPPVTRVSFSTYISPLASAVYAQETTSFSTTALGQFASYYSHDSSGHVVHTDFMTKETSATMTHVSSAYELAFSFSQDYWYANGGSLASLRSGEKLEIRGWIED